MSMVLEKSRRYDNLHVFIYRILKNECETANMTAECKDILNQLVRDLAERYVTCAVHLCRHAKKVTIDSNNIIAITKIWMTDPSDILDFAHTVWDRYSNNHEKGLKKNERAGVEIQPSRIKEIFHEYRGGNQNVGETAYIFLTAILEFVIKELLKESIRCAKSDKKITLSGSHVYQALKQFKYNNLFGNYMIAGLGYFTPSGRLASN